MVDKYALSLYVNAYMVFFLFDKPIHPFNKHTLRLNASLKFYFNVSSTNLEQSKLCVNSPLYIDTRLLWEQTIGSNSTQ